VDTLLKQIQVFRL